MGNLMPIEKVMRPNRNDMENYWDLQPIGWNMKHYGSQVKTFLLASSDSFLALQTLSLILVDRFQLLNPDSNP